MFRQSKKFQSTSTSTVYLMTFRSLIYISCTRSMAQYTSPELEAPYLSNEEQERLFGLYLYLHNRIHTSVRPLKILYHVGKHETNRCTLLISEIIKYCISHINSVKVLVISYIWNNKCLDKARNFKVLVQVQSI
jgi:hypothetical protein